MKKILIIEDDKIVANIYRNKFEQVGYDVDVALDGEAGLKRVLEFKPDVLQVDLMLPKLNGVEIIRQIRAHPEFKTLPIIVLSNNYVTDLTRDAWRAGANKCVAKSSCTPKLVLELVDELLKSVSPAPPFAAQASPSAEPSPSASATPRPTTEAILSQLSANNPKSIDREFEERFPQIKADLLDRTHALCKSADQSAHPALVMDLFRSVHCLAGYAAIVGFPAIANLANALEALLKDLHQRPKQITASTLRTIAHAVDCIVELSGGSLLSDDAFLQTALVIAVDDEPMARQALRGALRKANLRALYLDHPELALKVLEQNTPDLLFLDVEMPGMDGYELCKRVRAMPANRALPVVFVTTQSNFDAKVRSVISGGNELIAKPFLLVELAVKALTILFKARSQSKNADPAPADPAP